jgi:hypothetical protein
LVWHQQCPDWFFKDGDQPASRERVLERLNKHVSTIVGRYKGRIKSWDVVNEAIDNDKTGNDLRKSPWFLATGGDYIAEAFRAARRADSEAILYYNDFDIEKPIKREKTLRLIRSLKARNVPLDGIGIQGHWSLDKIELKDIEAAILAFHAEGLRVSITQRIPQTSRSIRRTLPLVSKTRRQDRPRHFLGPARWPELAEPSSAQTHESPAAMGARPVRQTCATVGDECRNQQLALPRQWCC